MPPYSYTTGACVRGDRRAGGANPPTASPISQMGIVHNPDRTFIHSHSAAQPQPRDGAIGKSIQFVSNSLKAFDAKCPAAIVTDRVDGPFVGRTIAVPTPYASRVMQHSPSGLRGPRRAQMLVNAHGRRWPTAGRFGLFGAILVVN